MKSGDGLTGARASLLRRRTKKQQPNTIAAAPKMEMGSPTPNPIFVFRDIPEFSDMGAGGFDTAGDLVGFSFEVATVLAEIVTSEVTNLVAVGRLVDVDDKDEAGTVVSIVEEEAGIVVSFDELDAGMSVSVTLDAGAEENQGIEGVGSAEAVCGPNWRAK